MIADRCEGLQHVLGSSLDPGRARSLNCPPPPLAPALPCPPLVVSHTRTPPPLFLWSLTSSTESDFLLAPESFLSRFVSPPPLLFLRLRNSATVRDVSTNGVG